MNTVVPSFMKTGAFRKPPLNLSDDLFPETLMTLYAPTSLPEKKSVELSSYRTAGTHKTVSGSLQYPQAGKVVGRILGALLRGEALTQSDASRRFGTSRLAAAINALKNRGWAISSESIEVVTSDAGRVAVISRYTMDRNSIAAAGAIGQSYAETTRLVEMSRRAA